MNNIPYNSMPSYQAQQYFPTPQGNVYFINSSLEMANVPMSNNLSLAICMNEGVFYIKTLQNGAPTLMAYQFSAYEPKGVVAQQPTTDQNNFEARLKKIEEAVFAKKPTLGGKLD